MGRLEDGWIRGWMNGWMDGWMDGWVGGWVDRVSGRSEWNGMEREK